MTLQSRELCTKVYTGSLGIIQELPDGDQGHWGSMQHEPLFCNLKLLQLQLTIQHRNPFSIDALFDDN
jgi:hypothetical protein